MNNLQKSSRLCPGIFRYARMYSRDSREARDGGGQGSIKQAGGAFAKMEVAHEEEYFYKKRQEQLAELASKKVDEKTFREDAIKQHQDAIEKHQQAMKILKK